jgi:hypothetical protein
MQNNDDSFLNQIASTLDSNEISPSTSNKTLDKVIKYYCKFTKFIVFCWH